MHMRKSTPWFPTQVSYTFYAIIERVIDISANLIWPTVNLGNVQILNFTVRNRLL
jgi:hypothetical protein